MPRPGEFRQQSRGNGWNVGRNVRGGISVDNTVNSTVNHIIASSSDDLHLDAKTFEFLLTREITAAIRPYAESTEAAYKELDDNYEYARQLQLRVSDLEVSNAAAVRQARVRRLGVAGVGVAAAVLFVAGGILGFAVHASPNDVKAIAATPTVAFTAPVVGPSTSDDSARAEASIREYFSLGKEHKPADMLRLVSSDFATASGGEAEFRKWWGGGFRDIDALVSPGVAPQIDTRNPGGFYVQVAWRRATSDGMDLTQQPWDLRWFHLVSSSDGYLLDTGGFPGSPKQCAPQDVASCSRGDTASAP